MTRCSTSAPAAARFSFPLHDRLARYASPEAWWASLWTHGSRRPLERMPADVLAQFQLAALQRVRTMAEQNGVLERMQLVYVIGRRA